MNAKSTECDACHIPVGNPRVLSCQHKYCYRCYCNSFHQSGKATFKCPSCFGGEAMIETTNFQSKVSVLDRIEALRKCQEASPQPRPRTVGNIYQRAADLEQKLQLQGASQCSSGQQQSSTISLPQYPGRSNSCSVSHLPSNHIFGASHRYGTNLPTEYTLFTPLQPPQPSSPLSTPTPPLTTPQPPQPPPPPPPPPPPHRPKPRPRPRAKPSAVARPAVAPPPPPPPPTHGLKPPQRSIPSALPESLDVSKQPPGMRSYGQIRNPSFGNNFQRPPDLEHQWLSQSAPQYFPTHESSLYHGATASIFNNSESHHLFGDGDNQRYKPTIPTQFLTTVPSSQLIKQRLPPPPPQQLASTTAVSRSGFRGETYRNGGVLDSIEFNGSNTPSLQFASPVYPLLATATEAARQQELQLHRSLVTADTQRRHGIIPKKPERACLVCSDPVDVRFLPCRHEVMCKKDADFIMDCCVCNTRIQNVESLSSEENMCIICSKYPVNVTFKPCGHKITCYSCGKLCVNCLHCQQPIGEKITIGPIPEAQQNVDEENMCVVCFENPKNVVFTCGHTVCKRCANSLVTCHMCRKKIEQKIEIYN